MTIRRLLTPLLFAGLLAAGLTAAMNAQQAPVPPAGTQAAGEVPAALDETPATWFVELASPPAVEGTSLATLAAEKRAFRGAASRAGLRFTERYAFDRLWNGLSVVIDPAQVGLLSRIDGVKAIFPVIRIDAPEPVDPDPIADLFTALSMSGADRAQSVLGYTGKGVKVAIVDTGLDYDHLYLGGSGTNGATPFPTSRVVAGYDFVGDAFTGSATTPVPDANPDDCGGHGTHVAGIVGANGPLFKGVAPEVTFGAYRVFGCSGSTLADIMIAAMERALADGMDVLNMSIGSAYQWPEYPSAAAATRLVNKGVVVVASIGNDGEKGIAAAGAPGVGAKVIGVASFANLSSSWRFFTAGGATYGAIPATGAPVPPTEGGAPLARTGTKTSTADACAALPAGSLTGQVALIRRGGCTFFIKASNAQAAGAAAVVVYNNAAGIQSITVAGTPAIGIPVVSVSQANGEALDTALAAGPVTLAWTARINHVLSSFTSYGLSPDLTLKPDIGAPGGSIYSTYPIEKGAYATMSGTSMASPHVAGAAALYLEAHPHAPAQAMRTILQNSAEPQNWSGNPALGMLDIVSRQGAGLVKIDKAIQAAVRIEPGKLSLGETQAGPQTRTLTLENGGGPAVTYDLSFENGISVANLPTATYYSDSAAYFYNQAFFGSDATVAFAEPSVTVPAGGTATVTATITGPTGPDKGHYGGYLVFTPVGGGEVLRVPFAGFIGDYQSIQVIKPTYTGVTLPWLARLTGSTYSKQSDGAVFTMAGTDIPRFLVHFDYQSRMVRMEVFDASGGRAWHRALQQEYFGRNSASGYYAIAWDGTTWAGKKTYTVPNGTYVMKLSVLKALGDDSNPADWETWTSPTFVLAR